ncbi:hypothetical protein Bca4012_096851 [Brassica carinata]
MKGVSKFEPSSSKIVFDDSEDDEDEQSLSSMSSSDEEEEEEEEKGKELTLEEIHRLRADGSRPRPAVPVKPSFSQVKKNTGRAADKNITFSEAKKPARANKNRPMELSSKRPVSRFREVIQAPKKELKKKLKKTKNPEDVEELKDQLTYVVSGPLFFCPSSCPAAGQSLIVCFFGCAIPQEKLLKYDPSTNSKGKSILTEHKKKEREAAKMGKKPYYLKQCMFFVFYSKTPEFALKTFSSFEFLFANSLLIRFLLSYAAEIRKQELIEKYNSLKESGKLSSFLDKRRKKNATKDHSQVVLFNQQPNQSQRGRRAHGVDMLLLDEKVELVDGSSYLAQPLPFSISTLIRIKVLVTGYIEFQHNAELYSEASLLYPQENMDSKRMAMLVVMMLVMGNILFEAEAEIRKQELNEEYNSLKESGKLSLFLDKRRKKNATKDHRYMPYRRADTSEQ